LKGARLVLAGIMLAALLGGYYLYKEVWLPRKEAEEERTALLLSVEADKVEKIRVSRPGAELVEVIRENGVWRVVKPLEAEADQKVPTRAAKVAQALKAKQDLGETSDLAQFGLDEPVVLEYIHQGTGRRAALRLGGRDMVTGGVYAAAEDKNHVSLLEGITAEALDLSLILLRKRNFFDKEFDDLVAFEFTQEKMGKIRVERGDEGKWRITSPVNAPASTLKVDALAKRFLRVKAVGFHEEQTDDLSGYGLAEPQVKFTAYFARDDSGRSITLGSATQGGAVYALWPDGKKVVRVIEEVLKDLPNSIMDIRSLSLVAFDMTQVTGITIVSESKILELRKRPSRDGSPDLWDIVQPVRTPADPVGISGILNGVNRMEAASFPTSQDVERLAREALEKPEIQVTLDRKGGPINIRFARSPKAGQYWAAAEGNEEILLVGEDAVGRLRKGVFELRERRLLAMRSDDVGKVRIERLGELFEIEKNGDDYMVTKPERIRIRPGEWTEFLWAVLELRFADVVSEDQQAPDDPAFQKAVMAISIFGPDGKLLERVEIAKAIDDDKWYKARLAHRPGLYDVDWFYVEDDITLGLGKLLGKGDPKESGAGILP